MEQPGWQEIKMLQKEAGMALAESEEDQESGAMPGEVISGSIPGEARP